MVQGICDVAFGEAKHPVGIGIARHPLRQRDTPRGHLRSEPRRKLGAAARAVRHRGDGGANSWERNRHMMQTGNSRKAHCRFRAGKTPDLWPRIGLPPYLDGKR